MKWYGILFLFFVALITANLSVFMRTDATAPAARTVGFARTVPVRLPDVPLKPLVQNQKMPDTPFLLVFFAADCPYCKLQHGVLQTVKADIPVVGVMTRPDKDKKFEKWLKTSGNPYAYVAADSTGAWARAFRVYGVPVSFVVGADKTARFKHDGAFTAEKYDGVLRAQILKFLNPEAQNDVQP